MSRGERSGTGKRPNTEQRQSHREEPSEGGSGTLGHGSGQAETEPQGGARQRLLSGEEAGQEALEGDHLCLAAKDTRWEAPGGDCLFPLVRKPKEIEPPGRRSGVVGRGQAKANWGGGGGMMPTRADSQENS